MARTPSDSLLKVYKGLSANLYSQSSPVDYVNDPRYSREGALYLTIDDGFIYYDVARINPSTEVEEWGVDASQYSVRKKISAGFANEAQHAATVNTLTFNINGSDISYSGDAKTIYIGTNMHICSAADGAANSASASTNNAVYVNLFTRNAASTYAKRSGFKLSGSGILTTSCDANANITINAPSILTQAELDNIWASVFT